MSKPARLSREDWASAALRAIAGGGLDAVAVEPLAAQLGATKGSFYWHFRSREELIVAALQVWEQHWTDAVIDYLEGEADPAERLRLLMTATFAAVPSQREIEVALLAHPAHPVAAAAVQRVMQRRLDYMTQQFKALGWSRREAQDRAMLLGYLYAGYLLTASVELAPRSRRPRYAEIVFDSLIAPPPPEGAEPEPSMPQALPAQRS